VGEVRSDNNVVVYRCCYHLAWCPKCRRDVIDDKVDVRITPDGTLAVTSIRLDADGLSLTCPHRGFRFLPTVKPGVSTEGN